MTGRKRAYYSESQIQKNLFTKGKEWMTLDNWKEYIGPYHKYSTGEVFTEIHWIPTLSKKLVAYRNRTDMYFKYTDLTEYSTYNGQKSRTLGSLNNSMGSLRTPFYKKMPPTDDDFTKGYMKRYFTYKRNEPNNIFFEIDKKQADTYDKSSSGMNQILYGLLEIKWKLTGPEFDEYYNGIIIKHGVIDTNSRIIEENSKKFRIFKSIVNNPKEFTIYDENF